MTEAVFARFFDRFRESQGWTKDEVQRQVASIEERLKRLVVWTKGSLDTEECKAVLEEIQKVDEATLVSFKKQLQQIVVTRTKLKAKGASKKNSKEWRR